MIIHIGCQRKEQGGWWICVITVNVFPTELTMQTQKEKSQHLPTWMDARVDDKPHLSGNVNLTLHLSARE